MQAAQTSKQSRHVCQLLLVASVNMKEWAFIIPPLSPCVDIIIENQVWLYERLHTVGSKVQHRTPTKQFALIGEWQ